MHSFVADVCLNYYLTLAAARQEGFVGTQLQMGTKLFMLITVRITRGI